MDNVEELLNCDYQELQDIVTALNDGSKQMEWSQKETLKLWVSIFNFVKKKKILYEQRNSEFDKRNAPKLANFVIEKPIPG